MKLNILCASLILTLFLQGCASFSEPRAHDLRSKRGWDNELYGDQKQPQPTEKLILENIDFCFSNNDRLCLAKAYLEYGGFLRSEPVAQREDFYRQQGFLNPKANFDNRLLLSKQYIEKAIDIFLYTNKYDLLTNAYLNLAFTHHFSGDQANECEAYQESLYFYQRQMTRHPDSHILIPAGFASYAEYIQHHLNRAKCEIW